MDRRGHSEGHRDGAARSVSRPPQPGHLRLLHVVGTLAVFLLISKTIYASYISISLKEVYRRL